MTLPGNKSAVDTDILADVRDDHILPCTRPWTSLEERSLDGEYRICCFINSNLGSVPKDGDGDLSALWNHDVLGDIRRAFAAGKWSRYCPADCPILLRKREFEPEFTDFFPYETGEYDTLSARFRDNRAEVLAAIHDRSDVVSAHPLRLKLHPSNTCNLRCRMCMQDKEARVTIGPGYRDALNRMLPYLEELVMFGGEPLACKFTREVLFDGILADHPHVHFSAISNGALLDTATIERLRPVRFGRISFSLDACHADTYESIRAGARYRDTFANIERFIAARDKGDIRIREVEANFCIQRVNFQELSDFVEYTAGLGMRAGFGFVTGTDELHGCIDDVRDAITAARDRAISIGHTQASRELEYLLGQLPGYAVKIRKLNYYYKLLGLVKSDRLLFFMRRHNKLRLALRKLIGI
jgi:hypothetical protein